MSLVGSVVASPVQAAQQLLGNADQDFGSKFAYLRLNPKCQREARGPRAWGPERGAEREGAEWRLTELMGLTGEGYTGRGSRRA